MTTETRLKYILLNGPPGSGKDTVAEYIRKTRPSNYGALHQKFSSPINRSLFPDLRPIEDLGKKLGTYPIVNHQRVETFGVVGDKTHPFFGIDNYRQASFKISSMMKSLLGQDYYAKYLVTEAEKAKYLEFCLPTPNVEKLVSVVSDLGFQSEMDYFVNNIDHDDVAVIQLVRDQGFENDVRSFVVVPPTIRRIYIGNYDLDKTEKQVSDFLSDFW